MLLALASLALALASPHRAPASGSGPTPAALLPAVDSEALEVLKLMLEDVRAAQDAEDLDQARAILAAVFEEGVWDEVSRAGDAVLLAAADRVEGPATALGDLEALRRARSARVEALSNTLPADHTELLRARGNLALTLKALGDLAGAREHEEAVLAGFERTLPEDHIDLLHARGNLAVTMKEQGDFAGARALEEALLATRERTLPEDHADLLTTRLNLASTMYEQGDLAGARALQEAVLEARERTLPEDHPDLLRVRENLASTLIEQGDLATARTLGEAVVASHERTLPEDHPDLIRARANLASTMKRQGDLPGARALQEVVLATRERTLPKDHPYVVLARSNLASTMEQQGDLAGARALQEAVLAARERTLPEDHPHVLLARSNLASTMKAQGDLAAARALQEAVLAARERALPEDHPHVLLARGNLAATMHRQGDLAGARALEEAVLAARERTLPEGHPERLRARANLAATLYAQGDLEGTRAHLEAVREAHERTLPEGHPDLLGSRANLAVTRKELGDAAGARALVEPLIGGLRDLVLGSLALAPRQAREVLATQALRLEQVYFLTESGTPDLRASAFELTETMRMVAGESARALRWTADPRIRAVVDRTAVVRAALGDVASRAAAGEGEAVTAELARLVQERDRLEREAGRLQAERGVHMRPIEVEPLARSLGGEAALVAYRRIAHWSQEEGTSRIQVSGDHLLVHVLEPDGSLERLDLGEAGELEDLVDSWRRGLGRPLEGRGIALGDRPKASADEVEAGEELRRRLIDPVLAVLGDDARTLHVCADDLVYLVPIDSLPYRDGALGDSYRIVNEVSCTRLVSDVRPASTEPSLLLVGGVEYDVAGEESAEPAAAAVVDLRSGAAAFAPLPGTAAEVAALRERFSDAFDAEPVLLSGREATREALAASVAGQRWVHVATHGWFAPEHVGSTLDEHPADGSWTSMSLEERVRGMAPMLLCGLALSGANAGRNALGRMPGLLTAEELCTLDLSACELAVLSACETNAGIRRAGQGIQSLQAALYAAGARSSVTSLWKVDDVATRRLMELFYTNLWEEGLGKADALWRAKVDLRAEGHPVRDWGGWVLTGGAYGAGARPARPGGNQ